MKAAMVVIRARCKQKVKKKKRLEGGGEVDTEGVTNKHKSKQANTKASKQRKGCVQLEANEKRAG